MQAAGAGKRAGATRAAGRSALQQEAVVGSAEQLVLPQREFVSREQLAAAHGAAKALDVVHAVPRPHHQVAAAEAHLALGALDAEQPAGPGSGGRQRGRGPGPGTRSRAPHPTGAEPGVPPASSPDVVPLAVGFPVSHEARARLIQVLAALGALEAGGVPLEVGRHPKDKLVVDLTPAAHAHGRPGLLWRGRAQGPRQAWLQTPAGRPRPPQPNPTLSRSLALPLLLLEVRPQGNEKLSKGPENRKRKQHNLRTFPLSRYLNTRVASVQIQTEN